MTVSFSDIHSFERGEYTWLGFCVRSTSPGIEGTTGQEHMVLMYDENLKVVCDKLGGAGISFGQRPPLLRIHSECLLGDVLGLGSCDCGYQLGLAFKFIQEYGLGVIIYLRQEGRGIGLFNKIQTFGYQETDTFLRNTRGGFEEDLRGYGVVLKVLERLEIQQVSLLSGNPKKQGYLQENGIKVDSLSFAYRTRFEDLSQGAQHEIRTKLLRGFSYSFMQS